LHGTERKTNGNLDSIRQSVIQNILKCPGTILEYRTSNREGNKVKLQHPATFPDKLASDFVQCFTQEEDIVFDPFVGSGTTCIQAKLLNRNYVGIDISKEYCDIAESQLKELRC